MHITSATEVRTYLRDPRRLYKLWLMRELRKRHPVTVEDEVHLDPPGIQRITQSHRVFTGEPPNC